MHTIILTTVALSLPTMTSSFALPVTNTGLAEVARNIDGDIKSIIQFEPVIDEATLEARQSNDCGSSPFQNPDCSAGFKIGASRVVGGASAVVAAGLLI